VKGVSARLGLVLLSVPMLVQVVLVLVLVRLCGRGSAPCAPHGGGGAWAGPRAKTSWAAHPSSGQAKRAPAGGDGGLHTASVTSQARSFRVARRITGGWSPRVSGSGSYLSLSDAAMIHRRRGGPP
jgi:hypothetical protein